MIQKPLRARISIGGVLFFSAVVTIGAQPVSTAIRVVSPQDGAVFEPGAPVQVIIEAEVATPLHEVVIGTKGVVQRSVTAPFQFTFPAPQDLGPYKLGIAAQDQKRREFLREITYRVETGMGVTSIQVSSPTVLIRTEREISVFGNFLDGVRREITKSQEVQYVSSNPQVATVTPDGLVKAIGEGTGTITVTYKGKSVAVPVKVEFQRQSIRIDIMPGSSINRINLDSGGSIPVAILTTKTFDVTRVDPLSVRFGPNGAMEEHGRGHFEDVDGDGFSDMVLHFRQPETGIQCLQKTAVLTGSTFDGVLIRGIDTIRPHGHNCLELPQR